MFRIAVQARKIFALALPLIILGAWAGCISICAEETAGRHKAALAETVSFEGGGEATLDPFCTDTCAPSNPAAVRERQSLDSPDLSGAGPLDSPRNFAGPFSFRPQVTARSRYSLSRKQDALFIRFQNFRI